MDTKEIESLLEAISHTLVVKTRMDFLLLTMSPDKVRDQLQYEFDGVKESSGALSTAASIVAKPD
jgi:hypothetical protein